MLTYDISAVPGGYAYSISQNGKVVVYQDFNPTLEGFQAMTEAEAISFAEAEITKLSV